MEYEAKLHQLNKLSLKLNHMKKIFILNVLIILKNLSFGLNDSVVKYKIKNVTVFLNGTHFFFRNSNINIKKGVTDIISSNINANSTLVKGQGNCIILDTTYK